PPSSAGLSMDHVKVSASTVLLGDSVTIEGLVHSQGESGGLSILFNDRKPGGKATTFDMDEISHIRAHDAHLIKTVYHPTSCGTHALVLIGLEAPSLGGQASVNVTINPVPEVHQMVLFIKQTNTNGPNAKLITLLHTARREFKNKDNGAALQTLKKFQQ